MANARILIVEDEGIIAKDLERRLTRLKYSVPATVASGEEAIQAAAQTHPDLVLMDIVLKGEIDGVQAAQRIRADFNIPVVYLTAHTDDSTFQRAKITEPFGYILKPFEDRELYTAVEMALYKHKMEQKLKESEQWLATILENIGDAVMVIDPKGAVRFMNPVAESLTRWEKKEALGQHWTKIFDTDDRKKAAFENSIKSILQYGNALSRTFQTTLRAKDGTETIVEANAVPFVGNTETATSVVLTFRDITKRKQAEEALQEAHQKLESNLKELQEKNSEIEDFIYTVSHDLKSPLVSIQGFLSELRKAMKDRLGEQENFFMNRIEANAKHLEALIQDLLDLSRVGRIERGLELVNLNAVLQEVLEKLSFQVKKKKVTITRSGQLPEACANPHRIDEVFTNLISNAIDYMGDQTNPHIEVGCREEASGWVFYVKDNGIGIAEKYHRKIFNIFERLPEAKQLQPKGTGVGLAMVKKIIQLHGGEIWIESEVGKGSTFYFTLPKKPADDIRNVSGI